MEYVVFILAFLGKVLGTVILFLLVGFLFALVAPVRLGCSAAGIFRGWAALLEEDLPDAGSGVRSEGRFEGEVSVLGGLVQAWVSGPGTNRDASPSRGGIDTQIRLFKLFTIGPGKSPGKPGAVPSKTTDAMRPAGETGERAGKLKRKRGRTPKVPSPKGHGTFSKVFESLSKEDFRAEVIRALRALSRAIHLKIRGEADFGLGDPGATGMVYGIAQSFMGSLGITELTLTPNFEEDVLRVKASMEAWFIPVAVLLILVRTVFSAQVRSLWWKREKARQSKLRTAVKGPAS